MPVCSSAAAAPRRSVTARKSVSYCLPGIIAIIHGEEGIVAVDTSGAFKMIRCINRASQHGQKTRNKILTDHFLFLLGIGCAY